MILNTLKLTNFRNYTRQDFKFSRYFNFIYGKNGEGKTNILEAISYVSFAKSFIGSSESDCIKSGEDGFTISAEYLTDMESTIQVKMVYSGLRKKFYTVNKEKVSNISTEIFGRFPVVFLSPHSLNITYGNPSERRRFFDILISQISYVYLEELKQVNKIVKQKNALLKEYNESGSDKNQVKELLKSYNEKFSEVSASVIKRRMDFLKEFQPMFKNKYEMLVNDGSEGEIRYISEVITGDEYGKDEIKLRVHHKLEEVFDGELRRGVTLAGPQRDDYGFSLMKKNIPNNEIFDLKNHASQGEHKTFMVALILAEYNFIREKKEVNPLMLFDDILSELDIDRVSNIISHLKQYGQIFLTTTDRDYLSDIGNFYDESEINIFKVEEGKVYAE